MPDDADLRGARTAPVPAGLEGRRATERAGAETRSFLEQIGQFSTSRLWRQKVGTRSVYEPGPQRTTGARRRPSRNEQRIGADLRVAGRRLALLDHGVALALGVVDV